jgi:hypothetical protein
MLAGAIVRLVGKKLPPRKFRDGDRIFRVNNGCMVVAMVIEYVQLPNWSYEHIDVQILWDEAWMGAVPGERFYENPKLWERLP